LRHLLKPTTLFLAGVAVSYSAFPLTCGEPVEIEYQKVETPRGWESSGPFSVRVDSETQHKDIAPLLSTYMEGVEFQVWGLEGSQRRLINVRVDGDCTIAPYHKVPKDWYVFQSSEHGLYKFPHTYRARCQTTMSHEDDVWSPMYPFDFHGAEKPDCECACDKRKMVDHCAPLEPNTSIEWSEGVLKLYPDKDNGEYCKPEELLEVNSCTGANTSFGASAGGSSLVTTQVGNPINCATGRKVQTETDYRGQGLYALSYLRTYRSPEPLTDNDPDTPTPVARSWKNPAIPSFSIKTYADGSQLAYITIGDRYRRAFYRKSQEHGWETNPSLSPVRLHASSVSGGRAVTTHSGQTHHFNADGDAVQSDNKNAEPRYFYEFVDLGDAGRQISRIRNRFGDYLNFVYDGPESKLSQLTDQDGLDIHYRYDAAGNLTEVIYPDDSPDYLDDNPRKTYLYENEAFPHHLTGIVDQNNQRYATFAYDENGRAIRTEHASGAERVEVQYPADGEAIVRFYQDSDAGLYREEHYTYGQFRGAYRLTSKTVTVCEDCTTSTETWDYNSAGLLERHTTPGGQVTEWTYDDQGRKRTETVAVGTPEARTTRYTWNDDWNRIATVETDTEITTYTYDDQGRRVETTVTPKQ